MDVPSLAWALILVLTALAILGAVVAFYRRNVVNTTWSAGFGACALGFFLLMLQSSASPLVSLVLGNALIVAFDWSLLLGLAMFYGVKNPWRGRYFLYIALWVLPFLLVTLVWSSYPIRASLCSALIAVLTGEFLVILHRHRHENSRVLQKFVSSVGWGFLVFHSIRSILILFTTGQTSLTDELASVTTILGMLVFAVLWGGAILLLDAGRLRAKVQADSQELARLNTLKDRVLAMTSHDLRGPLGNLRLLWGSLAGRLERGECTEMDRELLSMVDQSLAGTQSLLENLFSFAESQRVAPDPQALADLGLASSIVRDQWEPSAKTKGIKLVGETSPSLLVRAEFESVVTVLRNLVGNAVKYTPAGGTITVSILPRQGESAFIEVADTGIGMSPEVLKKTFTLESRASRPGTAGERGSGFGLVLVKELTAGWGGRLDVESTPGKGTQVRVSFPAMV